MDQTAAPAALIGLIVNPCAGLGARGGQAGSDGADSANRALALGPVALAGPKAARALRQIAHASAGPRVLTCSGAMGELACQAAGYTPSLVLPTAIPTSAMHTQDAARHFRDSGVALILFAGGDGTARDILQAIGGSVPVLGIPAGVKMHSAVFAITPEAGGRAVLAFLAGERRVACEPREVVDAVPDRTNPTGRSIQLFGYLQVPFERRLVQAAKSSGGSATAELDGACQEIAAAMQPGVTYLFGPGATTKRVLHYLGLVGTLLGIDAVRDGRLIATDLRGEHADALARAGPLKIILGVIGGQGFVLGRGNQAIGPEAIRAAGRDGLIIVASQAKLAVLPAARLLIDTGDPILDRALAGYVRVRTAVGRTALMRLAGD